MSTIKEIYVSFQSWSVNQKIFSLLLLFLVALLLFYCLTRSRPAVSMEENVALVEQPSGFGLFDHSTWIKGEKELQILEMRARKEELEHDLATFAPIQSARVTIDLPPPKLFGTDGVQPKASVIVALREGATLSASQLRAIAHHVAAAVHGLTPTSSYIMISDTSGKLYPIPEGNLPNLEESLTEKINTLMDKMVGKGNFHLTLCLPEEGLPITMALMVATGKLDSGSLASVEKQLRALAAGYQRESRVVIECATLGPALPTPPLDSFSILMWSLCGVGLLIVSVTIILFYKKNRGEVDVSHLAEQLKEQEPKSIASICAYLAPEKAEALLSALPHKVQKKVALYLAEQREA